MSVISPDEGSGGHMAWGSGGTPLFKKLLHAEEEDASDISSVHGAGAGSTARAVMHLLDSEKQLIRHRAQGDLARKDEELLELRRALVLLSNEADSQAGFRAESTRLRDALAAVRSELQCEQERRKQSDIDLERALSMLKENMTHLLVEKDASRHAREWKDSFLDVSRQNRALEEDLREQEKRVREFEQAREGYAGAIDQLRVLELEVKKQGEHNVVLKHQLESCREQLALQQREHQEERERLKHAASEQERASNQHLQELSACRAKLEDSEQSLVTLRGQMEDISSKLQDAVQAYEDRRTKIHTQKTTIKELTARLEEENCRRSLLSHELDTASAEIVELRMQVEEVTMKEQAANKSHQENMARLLASVEADRQQFNSIRALVEERYEAERGRNSSAEVKMEEKMAQLRHEWEECEKARENLCTELAAAKENVRKTSSQLLALGKRREQEAQQAQEVERALREEADKAAAAGKEWERLSVERERHTAEMEAARAAERDTLAGDVAALREALARAEETAIMLRTHVAEAEHRVQELERGREVERAETECVRERWRKEREREEERKMRALEKAFIAMFEETLSKALAPIFNGTVKSAQLAVSDATGSGGECTGVSAEPTASLPPTPPPIPQGGGEQGPSGWEVSPVKLGGEGMSSLQISARSPTPESEAAHGAAAGAHGTEVRGGIKLSAEVVRSAISVCRTLSAQCRTALSAAESRVLCECLKAQEERAAGK